MSTETAANGNLLCTDAKGQIIKLPAQKVVFALDSLPTPVAAEKLHNFKGLGGVAFIESRKRPHDFAQSAAQGQESRRGLRFPISAKGIDKSFQVGEWYVRNLDLFSGVVKGLTSTTRPGQAVSGIILPLGLNIDDENLPQAQKAAEQVSAQYDVRVVATVGACEMSYDDKVTRQSIERIKRISEWEVLKGCVIPELWVPTVVEEVPGFTNVIAAISKHAEVSTAAEAIEFGASSVFVDIAKGLTFMEPEDETSQIAV